MDYKFHDTCLVNVNTIVWKISVKKGDTCLSLLTWNQKQWLACILYSHTECIYKSHMLPKSVFFHFNSDFASKGTTFHNGKFGLVFSSKWDACFSFFKRTTFYCIQQTVVNEVWFSLQSEWHVFLSKNVVCNGDCIEIIASLSVNKMFLSTCTQKIFQL